MGGEITLKNNQEITEKPKKKMKTGMKVFIIILSVIIALPIIGAVVLLILLRDPSHKVLNVRDDLTTEKIFNDIIVDALDETPESRKINFAIKDDHFNQMLYLSMKETIANSPNLNNFYVEANDGVFNFKAEVQANNFLKTVATIRTEIDISDDPTGEVITFKITDLQIGKIKGFLRFKDKLNRFVNPDELKNMFSSSGLSLVFDYDALTITYKSEDFYKDIIKLMGGDGGNFTNVCAEILNKKEMRSLYYSGNTIFGLEVPVDELMITSATYGVEDYVIPECAYATDHVADQIAAKLKTMLDNGVITEADDINLIGKYLAGGRKHLDSQEKPRMDQIGSGLFEDYPQNTGLYNYDLDESKNIRNIVNKQIEEQLLANPFGDVHCEVTTSAINDMIRSSDTIGNTNYFVRNAGTDEEKDYKVNYVAVDGLSSIIKGDYVYMPLNLSFNGLAGQMTLKLKKLPARDTDHFGTMRLEIQKMYIGDHEVSESTKKAFLTSITDSLDEDMFNLKNNVITFDISSTMINNDVIQEYYDVGFGIVSNTKNSDGKITIDAIRK